MTIILDSYQDTFITETDVFNSPDIALKYYLNDSLPTAHNIYGYHPAQETAARPTSPNAGELDWYKNIKHEEYNNMPSNK